LNPDINYLSRKLFIEQIHRIGIKLPEPDFIIEKIGLLIVKMKHQFKSIRDVLRNFKIEEQFLVIISNQSKK